MENQKLKDLIKASVTSRANVAGKSSTENTNDVINPLRVVRDAIQGVIDTSSGGSAEYIDAVLKKLYAGTTAGADIISGKKAEPVRSIKEYLAEEIDRRGKMGKGYDVGSLASIAAFPEGGKGTKKLYRGEPEKIDYVPDNASYKYYTPNQKYAENYGKVIEKSINEKEVYDTREPEKLQEIKKWTEKKLNELEKQGGGGRELIDAKKNLKEGDFFRAFANLQIANNRIHRPDNPFRPGILEKQFMDEKGIDVMTWWEPDSGDVSYISK